MQFPRVLEPGNEGGGAVRRGWGGGGADGTGGAETSIKYRIVGAGSFMHDPVTDEVPDTRSDLPNVGQCFQVSV